MRSKFKVLAFSAVVAASMLTGCIGHPDLVDLGQTEQAVIEQIGAPDSRIDQPDGGFILVYSGQPFGLETYWMHFDKSGRYVGKERTMDEKHFNLVKVGEHTKDDIYRLFGHCAQEYEFRLQNQTAFMYRFEEVGGQKMAFWVQFDPNGIVTEWAITQDPWERDNDSEWFY